MDAWINEYIYVYILVEIYAVGFEKAGQWQIFIGLLICYSSMFSNLVLSAIFSNNMQILIFNCSKVELLTFASFLMKVMRYVAN